MRAFRHRLLCAAVALVHCGYLAACTNLIEGPTAEATPVDGVTTASVAGTDAVQSVPSMPTYRAGEDGIAALIPAE
jgi:hypothetical protein